MVHAVTIDYQYARGMLSLHLDKFALLTIDSEAIKSDNGRLDNPCQGYNSI